MTHRPSTAAEALAFVRSHVAVALILLDVSMPDMSGLEVLRTLRVPSVGHAHATPVLMFLADDDHATRDKLTRLGATGFVSKTDPAALLRAIGAYVRPATPPRA